MIGILKILFDMSFCYTLSGFYLYLFTEDFPSAWGVPVFVLSACLFMLMKTKIPVRASYNNEKEQTKYLDPAKIICCALPGLLFLFDLSIWQIIQFLPVWIFFAIKILQDRILTDRMEFADHFGVTGKILGIAAIGLIFVLRSGPALIGIIPYLITYLLTGFCLMRILREEGKLTTGRNILTMCTLLLCSIMLVLVQAPHRVFTAVSFIYQNVILTVLKWLIYGLTAILFLIFAVISWVLRLFITIDEVEPPIIDPEVDDLAMYMEDMEFFPTEYPLWAEITALVLLALAAVLVVFLILRRIIGSKIKIENVSFYTEVQESLKAGEKKERNRIFRPKDPRQAVRWYYRKYLEEGISRGARRAKDDTSYKIMRKYEPLFLKKKSKELRELYIKARYRHHTDMQKEDAKDVAKLWHDLKQR